MALDDFRARIRKYEEVYETITNRDLHYIKLIDMCAAYQPHIRLCRTARPSTSRAATWAGLLHGDDILCSERNSGCMRATVCSRVSSAVCSRVTGKGYMDVNRISGYIPGKIVFFLMQASFHLDCLLPQYSDAGLDTLHS